MVAGEPSQPHPAQLARLGPVPAESILDNTVDLRGYPYRHLVVAAHRGNAQTMVMTAAAAAEVLSRQGWVLVNVADFAASHLVYAILRREA
jgi:hypothetical protein